MAGKYSDDSIDHGTINDTIAFERYSDGSVKIGATGEIDGDRPTLRLSERHVEQLIQQWPIDSGETIELADRPNDETALLTRKDGDAAVTLGQIAIRFDKGAFTDLIGYLEDPIDMDTPDNETE